MSKKSSGGSRSGRKNVGKNEVKVGGFMRSNGTYVAGYTRSAPRYKDDYSSCSSESECSDCEDDIVYVRAYTRTDGTHVPAYTRAAPQRRAHDEGPSSSGRTQPQANKTKVSGNCKISPKKTSCSKSSMLTSTYSPTPPRYMPAQTNRSKTSTSAGVTSSTGGIKKSFKSSPGNYAKVIPSADSIKYPTKSSPGNYTSVIPSPDSIRYCSTKSTQVDKPAVQASTSPKTAMNRTNGNSSITKTNSDVACHDNGTDVKCYIDNAYNRKLGRVGKPLRTCIVRKDFSVTEPPKRNEIHKRLLEENKLDDLVQALKEMRVTTCQSQSEISKGYADYQYAIDQLQRAEAEESWREDCIEPSRPGVVSLLGCYPENQIPFADLELHGVIGRGGFGEVYAGRLLGQPIAFKKLLCQEMSLAWIRSFSKEVTILTATDHPNIVKMLGYVNEENNIGIVMEYLRGSLYRAVFIECSLQDVDRKKIIIGQVACALNYLHTHSAGSIAHCDIKSENVLLDWDDNALLCDFGLSALKNSAMSTLSSIPGIVPPGQGTPRYSAPEVLRGELLTMTQLLQADIYSLAIVVFEVITEEEPFRGLSIKQLETNVGHGNMRPTSVTLSRSVENILTRSWDKDAKRRLTAAEFQEAWSSIAAM